MIIDDPFQIWKGFHWSFFIHIQGLIICLQRFETSLALGNLISAQQELETASDLMLASGAAMELAGSFSPQIYADRVRPSMTPPHVQSDNFSGLMSWEHAALMQIWKRLNSAFRSLPAELQPQHDRFIAAYFQLATSHRAVCEKFGGDETGSLRFEAGSAIETLDKFAQVRWQSIDPNHRLRCPFHSN
ncbi:MAG: siderophore biosynthesis protein [Leptolyngbyaceae cyanobacterium SM1_3_5]|nr:siderophore biosynthesis protein [Leptolyngbyaceae cyanobacterium SM1_3_5]